MSFLNESFFERVDEESPCSFTSLFFRSLCKSDFQVCPFVRTSLSPFSMRKDLLPSYTGNTVYRQSNASGYNKEPTCMMVQIQQKFISHWHKFQNRCVWLADAFLFFSRGNIGAQDHFFLCLRHVIFNISKVSTHTCLKATEGA